MAGRRSVFSEPQVIELCRAFVPCADEVWRLQRGSDPECLLFRALADGGHYRGAGGTRQGIYVVTPGGRLLASVNSLDPGRVADVLRTGLAAWSALPEDERGPAPGTDSTPWHRWEQSCPTDGLLLEGFVRDLPAGLDSSGAPVGRWNGDPAWFTAEEARQLLPPDDELAVGVVHAVPAPFVERLARFHLVDNARGQTLPFAPEEVAGSWLRSEVTAVDGERVTLRLVGRTRAGTDGTWRLGDNDWTPDAPWPRGVVAELLGEAEVDRATGRYVRFELVAQGLRWGRTRFNGRGGDDGSEPSPLGWVLRLQPPDAPPVAPAFIDLYDAPWVQLPPARS